MIPFAILNGTMAFIENDTIKNLEIRILELSSNSFQFRLPSSFNQESLLERIESFTLHFYQQEKDSYEPVILKEFDLELMEKSRYWTLFLVHTTNEHFRKASLDLSRTYLSYIDYKLYEEDATLSAHFSHYPAEGDTIFLENEKKQKQHWSNLVQMKYKEYDKLRQSTLFQSYKFSMLLDQPQKVADFISMERFDFVKNYWKENYLNFHELSKKSLDGIHIGNPFCIHLLPEIHQWNHILAKTIDLEITYVIPPVAQCFFEKMQENLRKIHDLFHVEHRIFNVEVNDMGMYEVLHRLKKEGILESIQIEKGILLHKNIKDSRMHYRNQCQEERPFFIERSDRAIYLPFYQMNTSTFCTMYASVHYSDRGYQDRVMDCDKPCLHHCFLYPEHLSMIGRYNSLLGFQVESLTNLNKWKERIPSDIHWVVMNL